ncbi:CpsD/CapB family tyrosine-protein kinase [Rhizobium sp. AN80A]|uniref:CpsD/CapB family tyrosine-protein kinase n=1 Tax=Rhizobium sp. AN80A TaxID=3040673 RepID=UPI0024B3C2D1|nr:CpsD/CapB family tyrosine-protein kinase [Rhizobium sp. AN80A]
MERENVSTLSPDALKDKDRMLTSRFHGLLAWSELSPLKLDPDAITRNRIVTANRSDASHVAFDMMRTKLLQTMRQNNWKSVAITSPTPACGKTFTALNLAFSFGNQQDCRTLLLDLDLRRPQVGKSLGVRNAASMESFLRGEIEIDDIFLRHGDNLAIAANSSPAHYSAELLQSSTTVDVLANLNRRVNPDIVLFDLPPMLSTDDTLAFLPNVDCVVLIAAAEQSTLNEIDICEQTLSEKTNVLGVVLNKCQFSAERYGY